jgi:predicted DNA-binding protein
MRQKTDNPLKPFSVPLDENLKTNLEMLAKNDSRLLAPYVRKVLEEHVQEAISKNLLPVPART